MKNFQKVKLSCLKGNTVLGNYWKCDWIFHRKGKYSPHIKKNLKQFICDFIKILFYIYNKHSIHVCICLFFFNLFMNIFDLLIRSKDVGGNGNKQNIRNNKYHMALISDFVLHNKKQFENRRLAVSSYSIIFIFYQAPWPKFSIKELMKERIRLGS